MAEPAAVEDPRLGVLVRWVSALGVVAAVTVTALGLRQPLHLSVTMAVLGALLVLGEGRPVKVARGEVGDDEITISSTFAMALAICSPLVVGVVVQALAVVADEARRRKPVRRILFNAAQYSLSLVLARLVFAALAHQPLLGQPHRQHAADILPALAGACAFFAVNHGLVGLAVALDQRRPVLRQLREDLRYQLSTSGMLLSFAPVVVATTQETLWLLPLLLLPVAAIHQSAALAADRARQALHDALTGLPNRALLYDRTTRLLVESQRQPRQLAVMLLDLDHFKEINDTLGHHIGDTLIQDVGQRLLGAVRDGDTVARLGGDEFAVLLSCTNGPQDAALVADRLVAALTEPFTIEDVRLDVQASIGIALAPDHGTNVETLVQRADIALYAAKERRGCWAMYAPEEDQHTVERLALLGELRHGLGAGEIVVLYQPKVDARTGRVTGVEALARWAHPQRGLLDPDAFVPLAESTGIIGELTDEVLRQSLRQLRAWHDAGSPLGLAVNLSARQLSDLDLPQRVCALLDAERLPHEVLTLEVTETTVMSDASRTVTVLTLLAEAGIRLSIDDFGTGYSSLSHLKRLHAEELKIDRTFVMGMSHNSNDAIIVRSTIELGHNLGLTLVAEGVEDETTLQLLRSLDCDVVQGYLVSRPLTAEGLAGWLAAHRGRFPVDGTVRDARRRGSADAAVGASA